MGTKVTWLTCIFLIILTLHEVVNSDDSMSKESNAQSNKSKDAPKQGDLSSHKGKDEHKEGATGHKGKDEHKGDASGHKGKDEHKHGDSSGHKDKDEHKNKHGAGEHHSKIKHNSHITHEKNDVHRPGAISSSKRHNYCSCSASGDPHYKLYDGQWIHFYGICKYTMTKSQSDSDPCSFKVEVKNERRRGSQLVSYTRLVDVKMFGQVFRLHQERRLYVDGEIASVPYTSGDNVRIFMSGNLLQFVAPKCDIHVSFDGISNVFVQVNKKLATGFSGICGNCDGKQNDYKTKDGKDVSKEKQKYNLIGDSYAVKDDSDKPVESCGATVPQPASFCSPEAKIIIEKKQNCGALKDSQSPFAKCLESQTAFAEDFKASCEIDLCVNSHSDDYISATKCELFQGLDEHCAEHGFYGIEWRSYYNCPTKCGRNKEYVTNMDPCPKTCENHFYGTKTLCFNLPKREGCQCAPGYLLDGALCVKPKNCKCLEMCIDRMPTPKCKKWKAQGKCEKFPRFMQEQCTMTCGQCVKTTPDCQDRIEESRCVKFKEQGKCTDEFYKNICPYTCNSEECGCPKGSIVESPCSATLKYISVVETTYVKGDGNKCSKVQKTYKKPCGECTELVSKSKQPCNYCTGQRDVTITRQWREGFQCLRQSSTTQVRCSRCSSRAKTITKCIGDANKLVSTSRKQRSGCFKCKRVSKVTLEKLDCGKPSKHKGECNAISGFREVKKIKPVAQNCVCKNVVTIKQRACACAASSTATHCKEGTMYTVATSYVLKKGKCQEKTEVLKAVKPTCPAKSRVKGVCQKTKCMRVDIVTKYVLMGDCKCKAVTTRKPVRCCCRKHSTLKYCNKEQGANVIQSTYHHLKHSKTRGHYCQTDKLQSTSQVFCTAGVVNTKTSLCNAATCKQTIEETFMVRDNCQCKPVVKTRVQACCCIPGRKTKKSCKQNVYKVKKIVDRILVNNKCQKVVLKSTRKKVRCEPVITQGQCDAVTGQRKTTTVPYTSIKCKCVAGKPVVTQESCTCPKPTTKVKKCKKNCRQSIVSISYVKQGDKCVKVKSHKKEKCCCKPSSKTTKCNKKVGMQQTITVTRVFNPKKKTCKKVSNVVTNWHACDASVKKVESSCNTERKNYKKVTAISSVRDLETCACKEVKTVTWALCACLKPKKLKSYCRAGVSIARTRVFNLVQGICQKKILKSPKLITCDTNPVTTYGTCNTQTCVQDKTVQYQANENCKCVPKKDVSKVTCCCAKDVKKSFCNKKNKMVTATTKYVFDAKRHTCNKQVQKTKVKTACPVENNVTESECKNCQSTRTTVSYSIKNCKCVPKIVSTEKVHCCCPEKKQRTYCDKEQNMMITESTMSALVDGKIYEVSQKSSQSIQCKQPKQKPLSCKDGVRTIKVISHSLQDCKCVKKVEKIYRPCPCQPDFVEKTNCNDQGQRSINIYKYERENFKCKQQLVQTIQESCKCPKNTKSKVCTGKSFKISRTSYSLESKTISGYLVNRCVQSQLSYTRPKKCKKTTITVSDCKNNQITHTKTYYAVRNCRCFKRQKVVKIQACNCAQQNKQSQICFGTYTLTETQSFVENGAVCKQTSTTTNKKVKCSSKVKLHTVEKCSIVRDNATYSKVKKTTRQVKNCKCVKNVEYVYQLCDCQEPSSKVVCLKKKNLEQITRTTYVKKSYPESHLSTCVKQVETTALKRTCSPLVTVTTLSQNPATNNAVYQVTYSKLKNCKCKPKIKKISQPYRCDGKSETHQCTGGMDTFTTTSYIIKPVSPAQFAVTINGKGYVPVVKCEQVKTVTQATKKCSSVVKVTKKCNEKSGIQTTKITSYKQHDCSCVKVVKRNKQPCKCGPTTKEKTPCENKVRKVTITSYSLVNKQCKKEVKTISEACACQGPLKSKTCDGNGNKVKSTTTYALTPVLKTCVPSVSKVTKKMECSKNKKRTEGACDAKTGLRQVTIVKKKLDKKTCKCKKVTKVKSEKCSICVPSEKTVTECIGGKNLQTTVLRNVAAGPVCHQVTTTTNSPITCRPKKTKLSKCKNGVQKRKVVTYKPKNCKCVKKVHKKTIKCPCDPKQPEYQPTTEKSCDNENTLVTTSSYWVMDKKTQQCVKQGHVSKQLVKCNAKVVKKHGKCKANCKMQVKYKKQKAVNCKCKNIRVKTKTKQCCCPRPPQPSTQCVNNILRTTTVDIQLFRGKCLKTSKSKDVLVTCSKDVTQQRSCNGCKGVVKTLGEKAVNCKCQSVVISSKKIKCCCKKPKKSKTCQKSEGLIVVTKVSHKLKHDKCSKKIKTKSTPVNCNAKSTTQNQPDVEYGACLQNFRTVKTFSSVRVDCECVRKEIKNTRERCGCDKSVSKKKGPCNDGVQEISKFRVIFDQNEKKCVQKLYKKFTVKCACPKPMQTVKCENHVKLQTTSVVHQLVNKICVVKTTVSESPMGCQRKAKVVDKIKGSCDAKGMRKVTVVKQYAENCKCVTKKKVKTKRCGCPISQYPSSTSKKCLQTADKADTAIMQTKVSSYRLQKGKCVPVIISSDEVVSCEVKKRVVKGKCKVNKKTGLKMRKVKHYAYSMKNCVCVATLVSKKKVNCECPKATEIQSCAGDHKLFTLTKYKLKKGKCVKSVKTNKQPITCNVGVHVIKSKCIKGQGQRTRTITTQENSIHNCTCVSKKSVQTCDCACKKSKSTKTCTGDYKILVTSVKSKKVGCRCSSTTKKKFILPKCPTIVPYSISPCQKKGNIGYQTIVTQKLQQNAAKCQCSVEQSYEQKLCYCKGKVKKTKCKHNSITRTKVYKKLIDAVKNKCVLKKVKVTDKTGKCAPDAVQSECNSKTGVLTITTTSYQMKNCKCEPVKTVRLASCVACDTQASKKVGQCNKKCKQTVVYQRNEMLNNKCTPSGKTVKQACCCKKPKHTSTCNKVAGYIETLDVTYTLKNGKCHKKKQTVKKDIKCLASTSSSDSSQQPNIKVVSKCDSKTGIQTDVTSEFVRDGCDCKWRLKSTKLSICKCLQKPKSKTKCKPKKQAMALIKVKWVASQGKCLKTKKTKLTPIACPPTIVSQGKCNALTGLASVSTTTYTLDAKCKCVPTVTVESKVCDCKPKYSVKKYCITAKGLKVKEVTRARLNQDKCETKVSQKQKLVKCSNKPNFDGADLCVNQGEFGVKKLNYFYFERVGCQCIKKPHQVVCNCRCSGPSTLESCVNKNTKVTQKFTYTWKNKCECIKESHKSEEKVQCPEATTVVSNCNKDSCKQTVTKTSYKVKKCKCVKKVKQTQQTCCCAPSRSSTQCDKDTGKLVTTKVLYEFQPPSNCRRSEVTESVQVKCDKASKVRVLGSCKGTVQTWIVSQQVRAGCACETVEKQAKFQCKCKPQSVDVGSCDQSTCQQKTTTRYFKFINQECKEYDSKITTKICCCPTSTSRVACLANKKTETITSYQLVDAACKTITKIEDKTPACYPKREVLTGSCSSSGTQQITTITRKLKKCQCVEKRKVKSLKCKCQEDSSQQKCVSDKLLVVTNIKSVLQDGACVKQQTTAVKQVSCPKTTAQHGSCNQFSCKQKVTTTRYRSVNCKCVPRVKTKSFDCCCSASAVHYDSCSGNNQVSISYVSKFDSNNKQCVQQKNSKTVPVVCSKSKHKTRSKCGDVGNATQHNGDKYQYITTTTSLPVGCQCFTKQRKSVRLCGCRDKHEKTVCRSGIMLHIETSWNLVKKLKNRFCQKSTKVTKLDMKSCALVSYKRVKADNKGVLTYKKTTQEKIGCQCVPRTEVKTTKSACAPAKVVKKCRKGGKQMITKTVSQHLICAKHWTNCTCKSTKTRVVSKVNCPQPVISRTKCNSEGFIEIQVTSSKAVNCKCVEKKTLKKESCKKPQSVVKKSKKCADQESSTFCAAMKSGDQCRQKVQDSLSKCAKTCGRCSPCRKNRVKYRVTFEMGLKTDKHYDRKYFLKKYKKQNNSIIDCEKACAKKALCKSFDSFKNKKGILVCVLNVVTKKQLISEVSPSELRSFKIKKRTYHEKYCQKPKCVDKRADCKTAVADGYCASHASLIKNLCAKSCGRCSQCPKSMKNVTYLVTPGTALKTDKRYKKQFLIKKVTGQPLAKCKKICTRSDACRSFETFTKNGIQVCVFSSVDETTIKQNVAPKKLKKSHAPKRTYYEKVCRTELPKVPSKPGVKTHACADTLEPLACFKYKQSGICFGNNDISMHLCAKTCGRCSPCKGNVQYARFINTGLKTDKIPERENFHYNTLVVKNVKTCKKRCALQNFCLSFDSYVSPNSKKIICVLNSITESQLKQVYKAKQQKYKRIRDKGRRHYEKYCGPPKKPCRDLLSKSACEEYRVKKVCTINREISNKQCAKSCGRCAPCSGKVTYSVTVKSGLKTDKRRGQIYMYGRVIARQVTTCQKICAKAKQCASFETFRGKDGFLHCIFSTVTRETLTNEVGLKNLWKLVNAKRTYYEKICNEKCPAPITKQLSDCICEGAANAFCYKNYETRRFESTATGKCKEVIEKHKSPCQGPCVNKYSKAQCKQMKKEKGCSDKDVFSACHKTCHPECRKCNKKTVLPLGCIIKDGLAYRQIMVIKQRSKKGICVVKKKTKLVRENCGNVKVCKVSTITVPGECVAGKREILIKTQSADCKQNVERKLEACQGCCPTVEKTVKKCNAKGKRQVILKYWKNVNNCCRLVVLKRKYRCAGCPKNVLANGSCVLNVRVQILTWYFKASKLSACESDTVVKLVGC